jgi:hypothetical protein
MDSEFWEFEPSVGDFQSPSILLLHSNVFTILSLFRVRGTCPDFRIPPTLMTIMFYFFREFLGFLFYRVCSY